MLVARSGLRIHAPADTADAGVSECVCLAYAGGCALWWLNGRSKNFFRQPSLLLHAFSAPITVTEF